MARSVSVLIKVSGREENQAFFQHHSHHTGCKNSINPTISGNILSARSSGLVSGEQEEVQWRDFAAAAQQMQSGHTQSAQTF